MESSSGITASDYRSDPFKSYRKKGGILYHLTVQANDVIVFFKLGYCRYSDVWKWCSIEPAIQLTMSNYNWMR